MEGGERWTCVQQIILHRYVFYLLSFLVCSIFSGFNAWKPALKLGIKANDISIFLNIYYPPNSLRRSSLPFIPPSIFLPASQPPSPCLSPKPLCCSLCEEGNRSNHSKATGCVCMCVCDTGEWSHHHKQPLMALSGSSRIVQQLGPKRPRWWRRDLQGAKCCGHYSAAATAKNIYPNEFGPCQVVAKRRPRGHPIPS